MERLKDVSLSLIPGPSAEEPEKGSVYRLVIPAEDLETAWGEAAQREDEQVAEILSEFGLTADDFSQIKTAMKGALYQGGLTLMTWLGLTWEAQVVREQLREAGATETEEEPTIAARKPRDIDEAFNDASIALGVIQSQATLLADLLGRGDDIERGDVNGESIVGTIWGIKYIAEKAPRL